MVIFGYGCSTPLMIEFSIIQCRGVTMQRGHGTWTSRQKASHPTPLSPLMKSHFVHWSMESHQIEPQSALSEKFELPPPPPSYRGGSRCGPVRSGPPLLTAKSCKFSLYWGYISQFHPNFDTRLPIFANSGSVLVLFWPIWLRPWFGVSTEGILLVFIGTMR